MNKIYLLSLLLLTACGEDASKTPTAAPTAADTSPKEELAARFKKLCVDNNQEAVNDAEKDCKTNPFYSASECEDRAEANRHELNQIYDETLLKVDAEFSQCWADYRVLQPEACFADYERALARHVLDCRYSINP